MKQKITSLTLLFIAVTLLNNFAHGQRIKLSHHFPLISQDGITSITASENVDIYLQQSSAQNIGVKVPDNVLGKLAVSLDGGKLSFSAKKNLSPNERLAVYVWVNDLENIILKGNALAVTLGVLQSSNLYISASMGAGVSIKSTGKVFFDTPQDYQVVNKKEYSLVTSLSPDQK